MIRRGSGAVADDGRTARRSASLNLHQPFADTTANADGRRKSRLARASGANSTHVGSRSARHVRWSNPSAEPERDNASASSGGGPVSGEPRPGQGPSPSTLEPQGTDGNAQATMAPRSSRLGRAKHVVQGRTGVWAAVAALCVAAG